MWKIDLTAAACGTLLWAGTVLATTPQQSCDYARITEWKRYVSCNDTVVAKIAKGVVFDDFAAFAKCRHAYFKKWTAFQTKGSLTGSTCIGSRLTDNGTTVTDNLTGLVWEKKTNDASVHDQGNFYSWSTGSNNEDGTAFTGFLATVNGGGGFAGANGWRLPTLVELQTTLKDFACSGAGAGPTCSCGPGFPIAPCIDVTFGSPANVDFCGYWSTATNISDPSLGLVVDVGGGVIQGADKTAYICVRAVRGGL
ncbi:MAG: DUF1566 domain-containing protein [Deltaproteobacteria bacterium]|nr:DUF1566 domain-containing protein [Deltaproteobacteria bacterium]